MKLTNAAAKRLKELNISAKTEEEARKKLLEVIENNGIPGMDDEDIDTLIDIVESCLPDESDLPEEEADDLEDIDEEDEPEDEPEDDEEDEETDEVDEEDEYDDLAEEVEEEEAEELDDEEDEEEDEEDLEELDDEEDEEEEVKPTKAKKSAPTPKKSAPTPKKSATTKRASNKLDPRKVEEHRNYFDALKEIFPESDYLYSWVASGGVSIKYKGTNSKRVVLLIESASLVDGEVKCSAYLLTMASKTEVLENLDLDYGMSWDNKPVLRNIMLPELIDIIKEIFDEIIVEVKTVDKKLGDNRKKMEESLEKSSKKPVAKKVTKKPVAKKVTKK